MDAMEVNKLLFKSIVCFKLLIYLVSSHVISGKMYSEADVYSFIYYKDSAY